ncbi:hypothetical protein [Limnoglobus roseus]|uniref:Carboxypeptidase regulatory-like domain-containing protein n=1 Tax=Limnoglobus roseus TaxID=2598579 RepID=A0A5C1A7Y9_9BACT|nr:hypothetical protein [Limnoglobus roseus]QEL14293.1 carboxypeptidase regulatory-like domain-containing protein [Limnoglobus roseus]
MADPADNPPPKPASRPAGTPPMWMAAGGPAPVGRNKALVFGALLIVLVFGALVGILMLPSPPATTYLVSLPLPLYDDPALPPVAWAAEDAKLLVDCFPGNAENAYNTQENFEGKLQAIGTGKLRADWGDEDRRTLEKGRPFVFHVVGHAAVANGQVYVLPVKASATDPTTWVPLDRVLKAMADCPTPKKLLLLDLGRPRTNAFQGVLEDDVTPTLFNWLTQKRPDLPCPVLVSCSAFQQSSVIPQVGASAFAFYVAEGLRGAADGYTKTEPDNRVKVRELAEFVKLRVGRWARQNLDLPQEPRLFEPPDFADFDLVLDAPAPVTEDATPPRKSEFAKAGTVDAWKQLGDLTPDAVRRAGPQIARWAAAAVRAEQIYAAGDPRAANAAVDANTWWAEVATATRPTESPGYRALAAVALPPASGTPPTDPAAPVLAALRAYAQVAVPESKGKIDEKEVAARKADFYQLAEKLPAPAAAKIVWDWLIREYPQPQRRHVVFVANAITAVLRNESEPFAESAALKRLVGVDSSLFDTAAGRRAASEFLRAEVETAAALKPGADDFGWVAAAVRAADQQKRSADQLFRQADSSTKMRPAEDALAAVAERFKDVAKQRVALAAARTAADEAVRVCTGTAWAVAEYDWPPAKEWIELADRATQLADAVYRRPPADWNSADLIVRTKATVDATAAILKRFDAAAVKSLLDGAGAARPADLRHYFAILETSLLVGADRGKVWDAVGQIGERLHLATRADGDLMENTSRALTKAPALPLAPPNGRDRRARVAVGLLELGGHPAAAKLRADLTDLRASDERWPAFATDLRRAWAEDTLKARMGELARGADWDALERLARVHPVGAAPASPDKPDVADWRVAVANRHRLDDKAFRAWQNDRTGK